MNETYEKIEETNPIASETAEKDPQKRKWLKNIVSGLQLIGMICLSLAILAFLGAIWYWSAFGHHHPDAPKASKSVFYEVAPTPKSTQESIPESTSESLPETTPLPKTPPLPTTSSESEGGTEQ